ncbi:MAG: LPS assembly protein LptD [Micavibrio sp.]
MLWPYPVFAASVDGGAGAVFPAPEAGAEEKNKQPIDLEAETVIHDELSQTVSAKGNVELVQAGRIVKADAISYNLQTDRVRATGNVVLTEEDGTTYFADDVELTQDMKEGFVQSLLILLTDGSRFTAREGTRSGGTVVELKQASYTPCEPCREDPAKPPLWQIRAREVVHDEADARIKYRDAWFEFAGVPLAYTPYFSHTDGSVEQKSGLLTPKFGFDSELGAAYQQEYYWAIAPDKDVTLGAIVATDVNPVALAEYRQRFDNAAVKFNASVTNSDRIDNVGGQGKVVEDEWRGHIFGRGQWDMSDKWRSGFDIALASDDQYLRQYNIDSEDILENELYVERFDGRDYMVGRVLAFQDVRVSNRRVDQPGVLPEVIASFYGDPNGLLGGRWSGELSALGLMREGSGQDMMRGSAELDWQRRLISRFGMVNKIDAMVRGDVYNISDRNMALANPPDSTYTRGFAQASWEASYPFVKRFDTSQMIVAPVAALTAGTKVSSNGTIPNEDSQDFTLDASNLFERNRFPGHDLIEDGSRVTYGLRTGLYTDKGNRGEVFLGQSYRLTDDTNPFPQGSGLSEQASDYVGHIAVSTGQELNLDYRFQLSEDDFSAQRHEVDAYSTLGRFSLGTRYFYSKGLGGTDLDAAREQIQGSMRYRFYDDWHVFASAWYDLGENKGLRSASYGIDYTGQCLDFTLTTQRTLTRDYTGDSGTEIMFRIGLKNLGEFQSSGIGIGGGQDD